MSLAQGTRLGPYRIETPIGEGGMGEVYRARDARLDRDVAIKVLPAHLAGDPDALARFEREAKAVAALSHPNILAIHDFGADQGVAYAVMELLEGETLRERLGTGAISWRKAISIATEVADGLAAAHARGIVHRDLKPENIFLTSEGRAKVLDFGLARGARVEAEKTTLGGITGPGTVLGTVGYMSPEQVRGEQIGTASDIFSFGCVLHEMLAGQGPFARATSAETMAAVLRDEPPPLPDQIGDVPAAVLAIVAHCLEKRPEDRFQSAKDMGFALRAAGGSASSVSRVGPAPPDLVAATPARRRRPAFAIGVVAGLAIGAVAVWTVSRLSAPRVSPRPLVHLSMALASGTSLAPNDAPSAGSSITISNDGRWIACVVMRDGRRHLAVRALDQAEETVLPGTDGALTPVFSPDAQWIAFFTETELRKVPRSGGTATTICPMPPVARGATWADDGTIYFNPSFQEGLQGIASAGGRKRNVTELDLKAGESNHLLPEALPGGKALLFTVWKGGDFEAATVWSLSLTTGERKLLLESAAAPRYVPPGFLIFGRHGALFAIRFDPVRLAVSGEAVPVVDGVWTDRAAGTTHYAVARDGTLVYTPGGNTVERRRLVLVDRQGRAQPLPAEPSFYGSPRLSPDGTRVAIEALNDIWVGALGDKTLSRVTFRGVNQFPVWAPDGRHLAFCAPQGSALRLFWTDVETGGEPEPLSREGSVQFPGSWTPDGKALAYAELVGDTGGPPTRFDICLLRPGGAPSRSVLVHTQFMEDQPKFSPDGQVLAYVSDEAGQLQVYLTPFPGDGRRVRVSADGGTEPVWSRRGGELFYRNGRQYFSVPVTTGEPIRVGRPSLLFEGDFVVASLTPGNPSYDAAPDGQHFIMVARAGDTPRPVRLEVILGWTQALEQRLQPGR
jgi:eukaryotic-like serine/threonine-protein kinase